MDFTYMNKNVPTICIANKKRSIILLAISVKLFSANITQLFEGLYR